jgi:hypothetical protein
MDISLNWQDLVKLALDGRVEKDKVTVIVEQPGLADFEVAPHGSGGFVRFSLDETEPQSESHGEAPRFGDETIPARDRNAA